jgi:hypothetical protein
LDRGFHGVKFTVANNNKQESTGKSRLTLTTIWYNCMVWSKENFHGFSFGIRRVIACLWICSYCLISEGYRSYPLPFASYVGNLNAFRGSNGRFIPPLLEAKLLQGQITPQDLERMFGLTETDVEVINRITSVGYAGVIFDLETALVDLSAVYGYSLATLAGKFRPLFYY